MSRVVSRAVELFDGAASEVSGADVSFWHKAEVDYRDERRPACKGFGREAPFAGSTKSSEIGTDSVLARRSKTSTVGLPSCRSRPPT